MGRPEQRREQAAAGQLSNRPTGCCPGPESWPVVAAALGPIGMARPGRFTTGVVVRRRERCGRDVVKDGRTVCGLRGAGLTEG
jgi:hypothetical protein